MGHKESYYDCHKWHYNYYSLTSLSNFVCIINEVDIKNLKELKKKLKEICPKIYVIHYYTTKEFMYDINCFLV